MGDMGIGEALIISALIAAGTTAATMILTPTPEVPQIPQITYPKFEFPAIEYPEVPALPEFPTLIQAAVPAEVAAAIDTDTEAERAARAERSRRALGRTSAVRTNSLGLPGPAPTVRPVLGGGA